MNVLIPPRSRCQEALTLPAVLALAFLLARVPCALAYPAAPDALIYGMVKDEYGTPLNAPARVILKTPSGTQVSTELQLGLAIGVNYAVKVPMDAGTIAGLYKANVLVSSTPYQLYVVSGTTTNLPFEMVGAHPVVRDPASQTLQNLTIGVDSNGNGIPDAWEAAFLAQVGTNVALGQVNVNGDYARNGRTLRQEYLLGNYPFNPGDNFKVDLVRQEAGSAVLAFTSMTGRGYQVSGSADLQSWTPLAFTIPGVDASERTAYTAPDIRPLQIQTIASTNGPVMQFFRMTLQ